MLYTILKKKKNKICQTICYLAIYYYLCSIVEIMLNIK